MSSHQNRLIAVLVNTKILNTEAILLGNLLFCPCHDFPIDRGERIFIQQGGAVDRLIPQRSNHFQIATLVVPAPVSWKDVELIGFANGFGLRILLIACMRLRTWRLGMRTVGNPGLLSEATHYVIRLVTVASVPLSMRNLHVVWGFPLAVVDLELRLPPLLLRHLGFLQGLGQSSYILPSRCPHLRHLRGHLRHGGQGFLQYLAKHA
mmetsp:Transcript_41858/g.76030  ORF Transcript_41858/g.76030 Transcript_41858/m.76030 type:complete len:207 (+) Transcript_41858:965-1585(+)